MDKEQSILDVASTYTQMLGEAAVLYKSSINEKSKVMNALMDPFIAKLTKVGTDKSDVDKINAAWTAYIPQAKKNILAAVKEIVGADIKYVTGIAASLNKKWKYDSADRAIGYTTDMYINVAFDDDFDASKYAKKLGGWFNDPITSKNDVIYGTRPSSEAQNIEISWMLSLVSAK